MDSLKKLSEKVIKFRNERNWEQFHTIKDLCLGIGIEVAELQEIFLWRTDEQIKEIKIEKAEQIRDEIADVFIFLVYLCYEMKIDLNKVVLNKVRKNSKKYPVKISKNSNNKYNEL